jgi:DNA-binding NarL/FixJ family response regulator
VIRVLIAAASAVVRAGLEAIVRSSQDLELAEAVAIDDLSDAIDRTTADVALVELPQINEDWIAAFSASPTPVVVLTELAGLPLHAIYRGSVRAALSRDASPAEIAAAVCAAAAGLITLQPAVLEFFGTESRPAPAAALEDPLSPREIEVLGLLAEGLSNKLIAHQLAISEHTVKFHVAAILGKLQASSRTDAVMQGIRRGLVIL